MNITDVQIFPVNEERLKAYVTVTLDDCFIVRDIKVIRGHQGLFVAMPAKKKKDGEFRDICHPINKETRASFENRILETYESAMATEPLAQHTGT